MRGTHVYSDSRGFPYHSGLGVEDRDLASDGCGVVFGWVHFREVKPRHVQPGVRR